MCGICGIFNTGRLSKESASRICAGMTRAMAYRGPDEEGFYQNDKILLGHRRLSIIDLSSGQQPMRDEKHNTVIVFNGEIYNFLELRNELVDYPFKTKSDTEVILAGYQKWGRQVVDKLRGMFAFVIYDKKQNLIFAARDHLGKKPFYYYITQKGTFYFASDLQSLAASGILPGNISQKAIRHYFTLGYIPSPLSIYEGVYKLEPGHALQYNSDGLKIWSFWDIDLNIQNNDPEAVLEEKLENLLTKAVKRRMIADVPIGALLSGGIDSNLVTAVMSRQSSNTIKTFTAGFDEKTTAVGTQDERQIAEIAARYYGVSHQSIPISNKNDFILPELIPYLGEPLADNSIIPTFLVCQAVREHLKCALTGDGGDEPFGGYSFRYLPHLGEERIRKLVPESILFPVSKIMGKIWPASESLPRPLRLNTIFRNLSISREKAFLLDQAIRLTPSDQPLFPEILNGQEDVLQRIKDLYNKGAGRDELTRMLYVDVKLYMTEDVLVKADRMSMANSIELRAPLLDSEIVEFAFSLPDRMKIRNGQCKYILKKLAAKYACPQIFDIPKTGFSIPAENYLRGLWRSDFENRAFNSENPIAEFMNIKQLKAVWNKFLNGNSIASKFLWTTYILSLWFSEFHQRRTFNSVYGSVE